MALSNTKFVVIAYIVAFISVALTALGTSAVQLLDGAMPEFELNSWRFICQVIMITPVLIYEKPNLKIPKEHWIHFLLITVGSNVYNTCFFFATQFLPLASLQGLYMTSLITGSALVALYRKLLHGTILLSAVLCVVGTMLLFQPSFIFRYFNLFSYPQSNWTSSCGIDRNETTISYNETYGIQGNNTSSEKLIFKYDWIGYVLPIISGIGVVVLLECTEQARKDISSSVLTFWMAIANSLLSALLMSIFEVPVIIESFYCITLLVIHVLEQHFGYVVDCSVSSI